VIKGAFDSTSARNLPAVVESVAQGDASPQESRDSSGPQCPGVLVAVVDGSQVDAVRGSLKAPARCATEHDRFSPTGADLVSQLTAEVDVVLDPAGLHLLGLSPGRSGPRPDRT